MRSCGCAGFMSSPAAGINLNTRVQGREDPGSSTELVSLGALVKLV